MLRPTVILISVRHEDIGVIVPRSSTVAEIMHSNVRRQVAANRCFGTATSAGTPAATLGLHAGDWVEVCTLAEIMPTLDANGCLDALPFMEEMAKFCGQRFQVYKVAHKTCDTIDAYVSRGMSAAVHLADLRCDGGGHGGCQAGCLLFWKEAWLKRSEEPATARAAQFVASENHTDSLEALAVAACVRSTPSATHQEIQYRCQATELLRATTPLAWWKPSQYVQDLRSGNIGLLQLVRSLAIELYNKLQRRLLSGATYPAMRGTASKPVPHKPLDLRPGDMVEVRSKEEIMATLGPQSKYRGLTFDVEMLPHCGKTYRVLKRVEQIVDERTGKMIRMRNDCIILDQVVCSGLWCRNRLFCPRSIYPYWRENWLKRVSGRDDRSTSDATAPTG
jgi:hypothetical protein